MNEAIVVHDVDRNVNLVILYEASGILAYYRPEAAMSKMGAEAISRLVSAVRTDQYSDIFSDLIESYTGAYPYGGYGKIMKYSGSDRKQIDGIVKKLKQA